MGQVGWIKINTDIFSNRKIKILLKEKDGDTYFRLWIQILTIAGECNRNGGLYISDNVPFKIEDFTNIIGKSSKTFTKVFRKFIDLGMLIYKDNTYFTSIFNLFNRAGYKTSSMHDYTEQYYVRRIIHKNLGSDAYYNVNDLNIPYYNEYKNWASDEDFMKKAMDITLSDNSDEPFMLWLTTVSAHQPYGVSSVEGDKYLDLTENTDYPIDLRRYMSKLKTFDNSLGILLSRLEESGKLDDTVIALYGDHYPYGLKNDTISNVLTYDLEDYEVERTPMVIYNSKINHEVVEKYSSYINLTPTLANMFNLDYDARYYMGADVFSKNYLDLVVFADGSWKNKDAYYNASNATIKYTSDKTYNVDKVLEINNIVTGRMQVSASIIRNNYFNYLETNLKELEAAKQNWEENE